MWPKVRYAIQLLASCGYLLLLSAIVSALSETSLWVCFAVVLLAAVTVFFVGLVLAVRWADAHAEGGRAQWSLGSLLFLMGLAALYFALARQMFLQPGVHSIERWIGTFVYSGVLLFLAVPCVLLIGEVLLQVAVWLVRQTWFRRLVLRVSGRRRLEANPQRRPGD